MAPLASTNPEAFGNALCRELERAACHEPPVLLPMEDPTLDWVARNPDRLAKISRSVLPTLSALAVASNKQQTMRWAHARGIPTPQTWEPQNATAFADIAVGLEPGTFVAKPYHGTGSSGVTYGEARSRESWISHWERYGPMLIQERIPADGRGLGVGLLMDRDGRRVASFAYERLAEYPVSGGPSTDRRSLSDPGLVELSVRLLESLEWRGVAMVEWKQDPRDGVPKLMEINPRFWGSLELAVRAGVDFPGLYARIARGETVGPVLEQRPGVRCRWMIPGEILRYVGTSGRREPIGAFLRGLPGLAEEWDSTDIPGSLATVICTGALAMNPRYWRFARRR